MQVNDEQAKEEKLNKLILYCLEKIDIEIKLHQQGMIAESDLSTLEKIREQLVKMKEVLSPKAFYPTYDYIIRDSWGFNDLGEELLNLFYKYIKIQ